MNNDTINTNKHPEIPADVRKLFFAVAKEIITNTFPGSDENYNVYNNSFSVNYGGHYINWYPCIHHFKATIQPIVTLERQINYIVKSDEFGVKVCKTIEEVKALLK